MRRKPTEAIRLKCLQCCYGDYDKVKKCDKKECPLYEYRLKQKDRISLYNKEYYRTHRGKKKNILERFVDRVRR